MPLNVNKIKKVAALILSPLLVVIIFYTGLVMFNFLYAMIFMFVGITLMYFVANGMLRNAFSDMIEGKGILALTIDSPGVIRPFILSYESPYVRSTDKKISLRDVFNRKAVMQLAAPVKAKKPAEIKGGKLKIELDEEEYNKSRFALFHFPVVLYNTQINSTITKDFLSDQELKVFAEHQVLYLNKQEEELTPLIRNFGRYIVDQMKPKTSFFANKWFWIVIVIMIIIMIILFLPSILDMIGAGGPTTLDAIKNINIPTGSITPT